MTASGPSGPPEPGPPEPAPQGLAPQASAERTAELGRRLDRVSARIVAAAQEAGRDPACLVLVAVSKTFPAADIAALAGLGHRNFGESRDQEARAKLSALSCPARPVFSPAAPVAVPMMKWHFLGRLQRNKARSVAGWASMIHSLDRLEVVAALDEGARRAGRLVEVLVQVSLDGDPRRGGIPVAQVPVLAAAVAAAGGAAGAPGQREDPVTGLRLAGVMAVPPRGADPRRAFATLRDVSEGLRRMHPTAHTISAGMSGDLEAAVAEGATHLRVGAAIFGSRPSVA